MSQGEGSRGGKIIGHYKSGRAKYDPEKAKEIVADAAITAGAGLLAYKGIGKMKNGAIKRAIQSERIARKGLRNVQSLVQNYNHTGSVVNFRTTSQQVDRAISKVVKFKTISNTQWTKSLNLHKAGLAAAAIGIGAALVGAKQSYDQADPETQQEIKDAVEPAAALGVTALVAFKRQKVKRIFNMDLVKKVYGKVKSARRSRALIIKGMK